MNIKEIEKFLKRNNGYITSSEIEQNGIPRNKKFGDKNKENRKN